MSARTLVTVLALTLLSACAAPSASVQPAGSNSPGSTNAASQAPTAQPTAETPNPTPSLTPTPRESSAPIEPTPTAAPTEPLPEPELTTIEEIVEVIYERSQAEQVVVSTLDQLGIGLYADDGSTIRAGSEGADSDLYLFESEARGLIELLRQTTDQDSWIPFRDFHGALANLGFSGSAEELAQAYASAYEADFEAPMPQLIYSLASLDAEAPMPLFAAWLMFVDGFVPPNGSGETLAAMVGGGMPLPGLVAGSSPARWGVARDNVSALMSVPLEADPTVIAHLMSVLASSSVTVAANPTKTHEGHGSNGAPVGVTATVRAIATTFISPFSGRPLIPSNPAGNAAGIPVTWQIDAAMNAHGTNDASPAAVTDPLGSAMFTFTPRAEDANGEGYLTREFSTVQASVSGSQLMSQLYGMPSLGALVGGELRGFALVEIEWHEPEAMHISLVNDYDVVLDLLLGTAHGVGKDSFEGILALQEDGTWRGVVNGTATGSYQGEVMGKACRTSWSATQQVEIVGAEAPNAFDGDFYFRFYPMTQPSGSLGSGPCKPSLSSYEGIDYAPYNHYGITAAADNQGVVIYLPDKPGGTRDYPVHVPGVDANWHIEIEYLETQ